MFASTTKKKVNKQVNERRPQPPFSIRNRSLFRDGLQYFIQVKVLVRCFPEAETIVFIVAGNDMEMEMIHGLTGCGTCIGYDVGTFGTGVLYNLPGQLLGDQCTVRYGLRVCFQEIVDMLLGHDKRMAIGQLGKIENSENLVIFIDDFGRDFLIDDVTEYTHNICLLNVFHYTEKAA